MDLGRISLTKRPTFRLQSDPVSRVGSDVLAGLVSSKDKAWTHFDRSDAQVVLCPFPCRINHVIVES